MSSLHNQADRPPSPVQPEALVRLGASPAHAQHDHERGDAMHAFIDDLSHAAAWLHAR